MKIFLDTNVLLDFLLDRVPHSLHAEELLQTIESRKAQGFIAAITISNIYYILHDTNKRKDPLPSLAALMTFLEIIPTSKSILQAAIQSDFKDFEDGIQYTSALAGKCTHLVTRNTKDFRKAAISVLTAAEMNILLRH